MEEKQIRFVKSSDNEIKKLVANAVSQSTKKSTNMLSTSLEVKKVTEEGYKINKPLSGLLVCRLIMSLADRLSSKFHIYPPSFASRTNIHFPDNLSAADIISRHTSRLKGFIY